MKRKSLSHGLTANDFLLAVSIFLFSLSSRRQFGSSYSFCEAESFGRVLGEIFAAINGVCNPLRAFEPGDYGPSGEGFRHRFVLDATVCVPGGVELTPISKVESARPFTLTTASVTGREDGLNDRAVVNDRRVGLDSLQETPYTQVDLRVSGAVKFWDEVSLRRFVNFFNFFNRNSSGANYVTSAAALPVPKKEITVEIPYAALFGARLSF